MNGLGNKILNLFNLSPVRFLKARAGFNEITETTLHGRVPWVPFCG